MMAGSPMSSRTAKAAARLPTWCERAVSRPILVIASRNSSRSSALSIAAALAPISCTSCSASVPIFSSARAQFSAVCPPMVGNSAKPPGTARRSAAMILATISGKIGST